MRTVLAAALAKVVEAQEPACALAETPQGGALETAAQALERAAYNSAVRAARANARVPHRRHYADAVRAVNQALPVQVGPYPDDVTGLLFLGGRRGADAAVEEALRAGAAPPPEPRETIRRLFVRLLMRAAAPYARDRERALDAARRLETSCYNAAVRVSKESEEPPRRQWDSEAFVDLYSTRCGTVAGLLDPDSSACRAYPSARLAERLLLATEPSPAPGEPAEGLAPLRPEEVGNLSEKELCPEATAAERAVIAKRSEQRVTEKESNLFRCPHCGARRCKYVVAQLRSLDEAPDYLCYCLSCNHRFKGRS